MARGHAIPHHEVKEMQPVLTISVKDANFSSGIGERTIRDAIDRGELKAIKLGKRRIRIRPEALEMWLKTLEAGLSPI